MKDLFKIRPFSLVFTILLAFTLLEFNVGSYIAALLIIYYILGSRYFIKERENIFPLTIIFMLATIQVYAYCARLYLLPGEIKVGSMEAGIGGGFYLMFLIVITPFLSIIPTLQLSRLDKRFLFLIFPSTLLAAYWYFYLYSVVGYY